ncbi:unnamed protein product [Bursaphelenchus xylophilus]|uniref:DNA repair and recombination protein RAD54-like n=1 Tax=Bursaphelenchus xylophilus TaxID=6326 RepID=A0A1I7RK98_BURXY|nr:unnamed protein product [Bursaphelenchus xylophilus]CAG9131408.1 unnamed protein product [Bursaphelenchus xylophilus]
MDPFASDSEDTNDQQVPEDPEQFAAEDERILERPVVSDLLDRRKIQQNSFEEELNGVAAYDANALERGYINQAESALEQFSSKPSSSKGVDNLLEADSAIKTGELTPFDLLQQQKSKDEPTTIPRKAVKHGFNPLPAKASTSKAFVKQISSSSATDEEYYGSSASDYEDEEDPIQMSRKVGRNRNLKKRTLKAKDDGNQDDFFDRISQYQEEQEKLQSEGLPNDIDSGFQTILDNFKVTTVVWDKLYKYQKTGVRWLLQLHKQHVGGILADEMGLGKTIQIAILLRAIAETAEPSRIFKFKGLGPSLIVCPATLIFQWVKELNTWFPKCRVIVFHSSSPHFSNKSKLLQISAKPVQTGTVVITSYSTFTSECKKLVKLNWHYAILDEGHKIRNPDTKVTMSIKEIRTPHRILLSASPMQNNLKELWSLVDFVYPGRLGALKEFNDRFAIPITQGGLASASKTQLRVAYKCACILRDAINPYMLRRMKKDVEMVLNLPEKTEQVLFCDITEYQRNLYKEYLASRECKSVLSGQMHPFAGLIVLRKLCNHPDLVTGSPGVRTGEKSDDSDFGNTSRSGKLHVAESLLALWKHQGHKVLLFTQSKQMLTILEKMVIMQGYNYLRMDGGTPIGARQGMVKRFNETPDIFVFLLTTRVGGLGLNLTGANRVLIFDPDWNPSTDTQARERAYRIGQNRRVTIYRLMTSGTIEEKIYQRQVFKQFLSDRVLVNPKQRRFVKTNDLYELFKLGDGGSCETETGAIFHGETKEVNKNNFFDEQAKKKKKDAKKKQKEPEKIDLDAEDEDPEYEIQLTEEYKQELWKKAQEKLGKAEEKTYIYDELDEEMKKKIDNLPENHPLKRRVIRKETNIEPEEGEVVEKKEKKSKKRRLLDGKFEIKFLKKQRTYRPPKEKEEKELMEKKQHEKQDAFVLQHLLKNAGVHSALRHDQIVGETKKNDDIDLVEAHAETVAKRAAEVLKLSRKRHSDFVRHACSNEPSKKSIFGRKRTVLTDELEEASKEEEEKLPAMFNGGLKNSVGALSSTELFSEIKKKRAEQMDDHVVVDAVDQNDESVLYPSLAQNKKKPDYALGDEYEALAEDIRLFFVSRNGRATTGELLDKFKKKVQPKDSFAFRSILRKIALQLPNSHWALKEEYY